MTRKWAPGRTRKLNERRRQAGLVLLRVWVDAELRAKVLQAAAADGGTVGDVLGKAVGQLK
ncbi:MAG: hypothetical protein ING69_10625 [Rhodocyclaceae bacterium]|nr:hypothetical protein [Rhodocyclaceae bacterium]